jgi:DNA-binding transcriptional LysR family regulator
VSSREAAGFVTEPWLDDDLVLVAAPEFDPSPRWADVPFVTFRQGATTRGLVEKHFPEARIVMELGSIAAVKGNVRAGIGVALVSRAAIAHDLPMRRLVEVPSDRTPVTRRLSLVHRGARRLAPAAAALRQRLLDA